MIHPEHVCRVSFIPKRHVSQGALQSRPANTISQFIFLNEFSIGSAKEANIVYKSRGVHGLHCKISIEGKQVFVTDLFSKQGVFVNGNKITVGTPFPIKASEYIHLGSSDDVITVELFRRPLNSQEESEQIIVSAENKSLEIMKEADRIFKEANEVDEKTAKLIADAEEKANKIVLEKKNEMQKQYEAKIQEAIEEGHKRANEVVEKAEKEVETLKVEMENKTYEIGRKRERQSQQLVTRAEQQAEEMIKEAATRIKEMIKEAEEKAEEVAKTGESRKQTALKEKEEVIAEIAQFENEVQELQLKIANITQENKDVLDENNRLLIDKEKFSAEYEKADTEFKEYIANQTADKDKMKGEVDTVRAELQGAKDDLRHTMSKNEAVKKDSKATEVKKREMVSQIQKHEQELADIKNDIQSAIRQKEQAIKDAQNQKEKTVQDIAKLKKEFESEYQRRKKAIEERFAEIRERERNAAQERRNILKKHEKERLPHQVKNIATAIWNELSVELQDQTVKAEFFDANNSIPKTIEKVVERSVFEEHDLRNRVSAGLPLYKDIDPTKKLIKKFSEGAIMTGVGAVFALILTFAFTPQVETTRLEASKLPEPKSIAKSKKRERKVASKKIKPREGWQKTYAANLLFNPNFNKFVKYQKTNKLHKKRLNQLFQSMSVPKGQIVAFNLKEAELVYELKRLNKKLSAKEPQDRLERMQALETKFRKQLAEILGGDQQLQTYWNFQDQEFKALSE